MELKRECDLSNEILLEKCSKWVKDLCETGGRAWTLRVPVDMDRDPDILFTELMKRFKDTNTLLQRASNLVGNPGTNISSSTDLAAESWQTDFEKYIGAVGEKN